MIAGEAPAEGEVVIAAAPATAQAAPASGRRWFWQKKTPAPVPAATPVAASAGEGVLTAPEAIRATTLDPIAGESSGTDFWRVVVGPATTSDDREAILAKVKAMGYADAYFVSR